MSSFLWSQDSKSYPFFSVDIILPVPVFVGADGNVVNSWDRKAQLCVQESAGSGENEFITLTQTEVTIGTHQPPRSGGINLLWLERCASVESAKVAGRTTCDIQEL